MDIAALSKKITQFMKKYKYAAVVLIIGLGLMILPGRGENTTPEIKPTEPVQNESITESLTNILSSIDGAGAVKVLLTVKAGEETIYQTDSNISTSDSNNTSQVTTVMITTANKEETGLVRQINPPVYLGAIIVCQGAESPLVRLAIVDAVSDATGLGADQISVLKMK